MKGPPGWGPVALAVVHFSGSDDLADGYYCPPPESPDEICLGATMFYQGGWIRRVIAASPDFGSGRAGRFKTIGGHAMTAIGEDTYVAILERTESRYTWVPWRVQLTAGKGCVPEDVLKRFSVVLPPDARAGEDGELCVDVK
jgi:hypothetical protein